MANKPSIIPNRLKNASSEHPYVTGAIDIYDDRVERNQQDINADTYRKSETYNKTEADERFARKTSRYYTVVASEGDTLEDLLPAVGDTDTLYRVGKWDGEQYNPSKTAEYTWNGTEYVLLAVNDYGIDEEPTSGSSNMVTSGGVASVEGYYDENPEYLRVYLDSEGRIVKGIREDGMVYFAAGISTDASETYASEGSEYLKVYTDHEGHILWAIENDGNILYGVGIPRQVREYVEGLIGHYEENPEFIEITLGAEGKITEATRITGTKVLPAGAEFGGNVITSEDNSEYLEVTTDASNRIINSVDKELEDIRYGGINLSEIKRDADCDVLQCGFDEDRDDIYTIENNDSTITMEVDSDLNVYEVKDSRCTAEIVMEDSGEVYLEQTIKEI